MTGQREKEREMNKKRKSICVCTYVGKRKKNEPVDKRGKIENLMQSFDLLRSSDSIEAAQVLTMDRVGSDAEE